MLIRVLCNELTVEAGAPVFARKIEGMKKARFTRRCALFMIRFMMCRTAIYWLGGTCVLSLFWLGTHVQSQTRQDGQDLTGLRMPLRARAFLDNHGQRRLTVANSELRCMCVCCAMVVQ